MSQSTQLKNDRFIRALMRQPVDYTPIWIMRQAGRYLPEYRATRDKAGSFMKLCKTPELACEVTMQPIARFPLDASIIFSDILTIPDAMGLGLEFIEGKGPVFARTLRNVADINRLEVPDLAKLSYVYDAIRLTQHELANNIPLIGFCGSPWTMAAYMIQGGSSPGFPEIMKMLQQEPKALHHLLNILAQSVAGHLNGQIEAGANAVMIFDTWGGMLENPNFEEFSLRYIQQIMSDLKREQNGKKIPVILFTKSGGRFIEQIADSGCDAMGIDWETSLKDARAKVGNKVALQGNMNPGTLLTTPEQIRTEAASILDSFGHGAGHVFNLGHGITPDVPPEHVAVLVEAVHEFSKPYHLKG